MALRGACGGLAATNGGQPIRSQPMTAEEPRLTRASSRAVRHIGAGVDPPAVSDSCETSADIAARAHVAQPPIAFRRGQLRHPFDLALSRRWQQPTVRSATARSHPQTRGGSRDLSDLVFLSRWRQTPGQWRDMAARKGQPSTEYKLGLRI